MFKEPDSTNSNKNRIYDGEGDITHNPLVYDKNEIYQLPTRINSEHNRGVDGELSETTWPPIQNPDPWNKGIEEVAINGTVDEPSVISDARLKATVRNMWEL